MNEENDKKMDLTKFIKEHYPLITVSGVFAALTVYFGNLPSKETVFYLSCTTMGLALLLWLELLRKSFFLKDKPIMLSLFEFGIAMLLFQLGIYWYITYYTFTIPFTGIIILFIWIIILSFLVRQFVIPKITTSKEAYRDLWEMAIFIAMMGSGWLLLKLLLHSTFLQKLLKEIPSSLPK